MTKKITLRCRNCNQEFNDPLESIHHICKNQTVKWNTPFSHPIKKKNPTKSVPLKIAKIYFIKCDDKNIYFNFMVRIFPNDKRRRIVLSMSKNLYNKFLNCLKGGQHERVF